MDSKIKLLYLTRRKVYAFLLVLIILSACQGNRKSDFSTHKGRLIRFSFDRNYEYGLADYFYIDHYVVAHKRGPFEIRFPKDTILIPPRKMVHLMDTTTTGQKIVNANYIQMALAFNEGMNQMNRHLSEKDQYVLEEQPRMLVQGEITLRKQSGRRIEVVVPDGYPLQITVLEK